MKWLLLILPLFMLTGCNNIKELENRDYVMALALEKNNDYNVTMAVSELSKENESIEFAVKGHGKTIEEAIENANGKTKGSLYLGHSKVMILPENFTSYSELISFLRENIELSRGVVAVSTEKPSHAIMSKNNGDYASEYIYTFFEDRRDKVDLNSIMDMYYEGNGIKLPKAVVENEKIIVKFE